MKTVFITGATSGFGQACAIKFAQNNYRLILNGRRQDRLWALQLRLEKIYSASCFLAPFDVQDKEAAFSVITTLPEDWQNIDILINNAGLALGRDLFEDADLADWETMIDTNLKGLLYVSKATLPFMIKNGGGHIVNVGSIAAKAAYERGNVYCATKAAVDTISKAMRIDLLPHHIKVTAIHPGAAETEFSVVRFKGDEDKAQKVYDGFKPMQAADIADIIFYCATLPPHICINDLVVTPTQQADSFYFNKDGR